MSGEAYWYMRRHRWGTVGGGPQSPQNQDLSQFGGGFFFNPDTLSGSNGQPIKIYASAPAQSTTTLPTYKTGAVNGKASVLYDGVDDYTNDPDYTLTNGGNKWTLACALRCTAPGTNCFMLSTRLRNMAVQVYQNQMYIYVGGTWAHFPYASTAVRVLSAQYDGTQGLSQRLRVWLEGTDVSSQLVYQANIPATLQPEAAGLEIGRPYGVADAYFKGDVLEWGLYAPTPLSDVSRQGAVSYLRTKYGV